MASIYQKSLGAILLASSTFLATAKTVPQNNITVTSRACQPPNDQYPFCNTALSVDERVNDLIERLWTVNASVIPQMLTARNQGRSAVPQLGIPQQDFGLNAIHGVQCKC